MPAQAEAVVYERSNERCIGVCKWFSDRRGFGFINVCTGRLAGSEVFVHFRALSPKVSPYRSLTKGEYVSLRLESSDSGLQAVDVQGVLGGALMCDHGKPARPAGRGSSGPWREAAEPPGLHRGCGPLAAQS